MKRCRQVTHEQLECLSLTALTGLEFMPLRRHHEVLESDKRWRRAITTRGGVNAPESQGEGHFWRGFLPRALGSKARVNWKRKEQDHEAKKAPQDAGRYSTARRSHAKKTLSPAFCRGPRSFPHWSDVVLTAFQNLHAEKRLPWLVHRELDP